MWMLPLHRPSSRTSDPSGAMKRPSDVPPPVDSSGAAPVSSVTASVREAIERAAGKAKTPKDLILITGSFYTIGEARECLGEKAVLGALRESR